MFGNKLRLFRIFGIPIYLDVSWLIILVLLSFSMTQMFMAQELGLEPAGYWLMGVSTALIFFACIVLHELGHAVVALRSGIPVGSITLFLFGGVAKIEGEPPSAWKEFWMAVAGPIVSLILAAIFFATSVAANLAGWPAFLVYGLYYLGWINSVVLIFNMIPAFPLDGGRVLRSILWASTGNLTRSTRWAALTGQTFAWFLMGLGVFAVVFAGAFLPGIWFGLIGLFLYNAAQSGYQSVLVKRALQGEPINRFMNPHPITVSPKLDLRSWVEDYVYVHHHKTYPVLDDGHLVGVMATRMLADFPRHNWADHQIAEVMDTNIGPLCISAQADALEAFERIQKTGSGRLFVTTGDQLIGIISVKDLVRFLHLKLELEGDDDQDNLPPQRKTREEETVGV